MTSSSALKQQQTVVVVKDMNVIDSKVDKCESENKKNKPLSNELPSDFIGIEIQLMSDYYQQLFQRLPEPKLLFKHFMLLLQTPRPSSKLDKIRAYLLHISKQLKNVQYSQDSIGNVCLRKPGSDGYESAAGVIIQCHMDMVCTKIEECKHDFENDGIKAYISDDGNWLKAHGTTLGADDGIGVAAGLALMEDPCIDHGPLEILITVDEETTMIGAIELQSKWLKNQYLINVDSEESHRICIGCAGGFEKYIEVPMINNSDITDMSVLAFKLNISGLLGGHTGIEIHVGRANAIILMARLLNHMMIDLLSKSDAQMCLKSFNGGNAANAIPCYCNCELLLIGDQSLDFEKVITDFWCTNIVPEYSDIEKNMQMKCIPIDNKTDDNFICDFQSTQSFINLMMILPHGVIRMSTSVNGLVQTSVAFSLVEYEAGKCNGFAKCTLFCRSSSMKELTDFDRKMQSMIHLCNAGFICNKNDERLLIASDMCNSFCGWDPNTKSSLLNECKIAHLSSFGFEADVYAVHAGLECGLIMEKYPDMDCISIGPTILHAHSTDEKIDLRTVADFYQWLRETVTRIAHSTI